MQTPQYLTQAPRQSPATAVEERACSATRHRASTETPADSKEKQETTLSTHYSRLTTHSPKAPRPFYSLLTINYSLAEGAAMIYRKLTADKTLKAKLKTFEFF